MIRTLFIGSNWEALETLQTLHKDDRFKVIGLITQPDKPVGRRQILTETEVKKFAKSNDIDVFHTEGDPKRYKEALKLFNPELIVCKSFGEILPEFFLEAPKYGTINIHYSLLPKYRGAVPIQKAILEGDDITGITYVKMIKKLDAGEILKVFEHPIKDDDTNFSLRKRLVQITSDTIGDVLEKWVNGEIETTPQVEKDATYCWQSDVSKENAFVDWNILTAEQIDRMVRALLPWPVAWTYYQDKRLKLFQLKIAKAPKTLKPGEYYFDTNDLYVGSKGGNKALILKKVQLEGKNEVDGPVFARGMQI